MTRRMILLAFCAALAAGCKDDKTDNSKNQTPNDAPIGPPSAVGGGASGQLKGRESKLNP